MASDKENTRQQFTFRREWYDLINSFESANVRWEVMDMITDRAFCGELSDDFNYSATAKAIFKIIEPKLLEEIRKHDDLLSKRRESGRLGGLAKATKCQASLSSAKQVVSDAKQVLSTANQVLQNDTAEQEPKRKVFRKPTIDEIKAYIAEKGYHFDAEQFFAFYESKGWKVGNQPMKDWKMACVTWEGRTGSRTQQPTQSQQQRKTFTDWNSTEALTEQYKIDEERRRKQKEEEEKEERIRSFQVQILDYLSRHRDDYKTLEQGDVKENDYFTITGLPDGTMYWNCKCANCKRRTYYDEAMKCVNECPLDAPMRPKGDDDTSYIWDKVSKMWVMY
jgi:type II secretory pathway pseudopilin PulG